MRFIVDIDELEVFDYPTDTLSLWVQHNRLYPEGANLVMAFILVCFSAYEPTEKNRQDPISHRVKRHLPQHPTRTVHDLYCNGMNRKYSSI